MLLPQRQAVVCLCALGFTAGEAQLTLSLLSFPLEASLSGLYLVLWIPQGSTSELHLGLPYCLLIHIRM